MNDNDVCMHARMNPCATFIRDSCSSSLFLDYRFPSSFLHRCSAVHLRLRRGRPLSPSRPRLPRSTCPLNDYQSMGVYPHPLDHVDLASALVPARDPMAEGAP